VSIWKTIGKAGEVINSTISKIYGQKVKLGVIVAPAEEKLPGILPKISITAPKPYGVEEKLDYTPYLVIGGLVLGIVLLAR